MRVKAAVRSRKAYNQPGTLMTARKPFEKLSAVSPQKESQIKMVRYASSKHQWSNRVQIKIIRLAKTISDLFHREPAVKPLTWFHMKIPFFFSFSPKENNRHPHSLSIVQEFSYLLMRNISGI
ncbi:hypothetical protein [Cytobacillus firmus]|uniref:magnesium chelatase subunit ChlI family protein n=1 Tax=Cytobacillus firmus TaxID=1399 RepID=UPI0021635E28|nr:hypothetical protein [Cytobacillus firmus]MCS0654816.1 hypothetical protein [Cytobacillus firmus]